MPKIRITSRQLKVIIRKSAHAEAFGDLDTLVKCQALLLLTQEDIPISKIAEVVNRTSECVRLWVVSFIEKGVESIKIPLSKGRQPKMSSAQCKELKKMLDQSPSELGFAGGCWNSGMISILIEQEFGVKYSVKYIPELMRRLGYSWQKARFEAALADSQKRAEWLSVKWPEILARARKSKSYLLFEDESTFTLWGSLSYTWSRKGVQPILKTAGKRKSYKMFGLIDYFSGKFFYQGTEGKLNSDSYIDFLKQVKSKTRKPLIIVHDCAGYHTSSEVTDFLDTEPRFTVFKLPAFSPDFNPIEKLWKKIKAIATHLVYCPDFDDLVIRVESAMDYFSKNPEEILKTFGKFKKMELSFRVA